MARRALAGALLAFVVLVPLAGVFCSTCLPGHCPLAARAAAVEAAVEAAAMTPMAACHGMAPVVPPRQAATRADCCGPGGDEGLIAEAVPTSAPAMSASAAPAVAVLAPRPAPRSGDDSRPPRAPVPLYTLHSTLLI